MELREMDAALPPGFRFYPSDEELVCFYLRKKVANQKVAWGTLVEVDLHAREPWELPDVAKLTEEEWYFFSFRDRKYATGSRTNRATKTGYWKATSKDRAIHEPGTHALVGMRKTLVFYRGRAPNGQKTGWVMHEFRLETPNTPPKEDWVLCRVFDKSKPSQAEQSSGGGGGGGGGQYNHAAIAAGAGLSSPPALLCSPPADPTTAVGKFYQQHQVATTDSHSGSSGGAILMDLAMLQQGSFLEYCFPVALDGVAVGHKNAGCTGGGGAMAMAPAELRLGHVGLEEHGMGMGEMEYSQAQGGCCYGDVLYF